MSKPYLDQREDLNDEIAAFIQKQTTQKDHMPITSKIIKLTPDRARYLLSNQINNRPYSKYRIDQYVSEIEAGVA